MKKVLLAVLFLLPFSLFSKGVIIDHSNVDITKLSKESIDCSTNTLKVIYQHTSHGSQLISGLDALEAYNNELFKYVVSSSGYDSNYFFNDYGMQDAADLGHGGDLSFVNATKNVLNSKNCNRNVVIWSWCGGCSDNTIEGIDSYLNAMSQLESQYPNIVFVYMTGHLDGSGQNGNLNVINERIRNYCKTNDKVLFDFADIESYAPGGNINYMLLNANDACDYDGGNWADEWLTANPNSQLAQITNNCSGCAHSNNLNCSMKGIATWQMFEWISINKFASTLKVEVDSTTKENAIISVYPNPADNKVSIDYYLKEKSTIRIDIYDINGNHVKSVLNEVVRDQGETTEIADILSLPIGTYNIRLMVGDDFKTKSFVVVR
jgi:hypothetical protein